jgi:predicted CopG family antitoxin
MTSKNISITKDVYDLLSKMKMEGESFSEAIRRLAARRNLEENAGLWTHLPDEEMKAFGKSLRDLRDRARESLKVG